MSREKDLAKNTLIIAIGTILPKITSFITLPILTASLTKAEYGTYDLITNLISLVMPFVTIQVQSAAFRFLLECRGDKRETDSVITNLLCFVSGTSLIASVILFFALRKIGTVLRLLICLYVFADTFILAVRQIIRGFSLNKVYSLGAALQSVVNTVLIVLTIGVADQGLAGLMLSFVVAILLGILFMFIKGSILSHINFSLLSKAMLRKMIGYSWPLVPNVISDWVLRVSDRAVIVYFLGIESAAVYAVANKIPSLLSLIKTTFTFSWQENASLASLDGDEDKYFSSMLDVIVRILSGVTALLVAFLPIMFALLIRGDYGSAYRQMPILFMGTLLSILSVYLGGIDVAHKRTKSMGLTTSAAAAVNLAVDLLLIKVIGIYAGSVSTLVSYLFLVVYRMYHTKKFHKIYYDFKKMSVYGAVLIILCVLCWFDNFYLNLLNMVLGTAFAVVINKGLIKSTVVSIKNRLNTKRGEK